MPVPIELQAIQENLAREVDIVFGTLRDKGAKRFLRAFVAAGFMVFGAYMLLYRPPQIKSARLDAEIAHAKQMHDYGEKYSELRDQLSGAYARLPSVNDREQWLSNSVRALLDASKLESNDFKPMRESEKNGLIFQLSPITLDLRFADLYGLILRIENAKPIMHLQRVDIMKANDGGDPTAIGMAKAGCDITTVIPKKRLDQ
jgi:hypothetical protein